MSLKAMNYVWGNAQASGSALLALLAIADCADDRGIAYPSQLTIARKARISVRNLRRVITELCESGDLVVLETGDGRRSSTYQVTMREDEGGHPVLPQNASTQGGHRVRPDGKKEGGQNGRPGGTQLCPPREDTAMSTEQSYNGHSKNIPLPPSFPKSAETAATVSPPPSFDAPVGAREEGLAHEPQAQGEGKEIVAAQAASTEAAADPGGTAAIGDRRSLLLAKTGKLLLGKKELLEAFCPFFQRSVADPLSSTENEAFDTLGSVTESDIAILVRWMQIKSPDEAIKHRPETLLSLIRHWHRNRDRAAARVQRFAPAVAAAQKPPPPSCPILSPMPTMRPGSEPIAHTIYLALLQQLGKTLRKESIDRWFSPLKPVGLRDPDEALVLASSNEIYPHWIRENYATQLDSAAGSRKIVFCKMETGENR